MEVKKIKEEPIQLKIKKLENIDEFIKEVNENNKIILKTVRREGNILEKNIMYMFVSVDGTNIYYLSER